MDARCIPDNTENFMKQLKEIIIEKLKISKNSKSGKPKYTCQPKDWDELSVILKERLSKDKDADLNDIDVSKVTNMSYIFHDLDPHNIDISKWDVSNCKNFNLMFCDCENLNCDLDDWEVNVKPRYMINMFYNCKSLKNIPNWYHE